MLSLAELEKSLLLWKVQPLISTWISEAIPLSHNRPRSRLLISCYDTLRKCAYSGSSVLHRFLFLFPWLPQYWQWWARKVYVEAVPCAQSEACMISAERWKTLQVSHGITWVTDAFCKVLQVVAPRVVYCAQDKRIERFIEFLPGCDAWRAPVVTCSTQIGFMWFQQDCKDSRTDAVSRSDATSLSDFW